MKIVIFSLVALAISLAQGQEEICPEGAQDWPHHECHLFYLCDNGVGYEQECPGGLYWNPEIHNCDFPANVPECVDGTRPPTGSTTTSMPTTDAPEETTVTDAPSTGTAPPSTPTPTTAPSTPTAMPETTTTSGPSTNTAGSTTEGLPETELPLTTTTEGPPETEAPLTTTRLPPGVCPETGIHKIPHESLCEAYYLCVNGDRQEPHNTCPEGLYFDPSIEECNLAADVDCPYAPTTLSPTTTLPTTEAPFPVCPPEGLHYLPYPRNCTLYIVCVDGTAIIYRCPEGTLFDTAKLVCESETTAVCTVRGESPLLTRITHVRREKEESKHFNKPIMTVDKIDVVVSKSDEGFFHNLLSGWGFF